MTTATELTCEEFIGALASKVPAPGGGGAAAYMGAIGTALGNMVGALTVGKKKYADVEEDILALMAKADDLQQRFIELVTKDAEVFVPLSKAYGLPTETEEERLHKAAVMETCLRECCEVPLSIMIACCEAIDLHAEFAARGTTLAISDVGCGAVCCKAALQAASLNVFINTKSMADRAYAEEANAKARAMVESYTTRADEIFSDVEMRLS